MLSYNNLFYILYFNSKPYIKALFIFSVSIIWRTINCNFYKGTFCIISFIGASYFFV